MDSNSYKYIWFLFSGEIRLNKTFWKSVFTSFLFPEDQIILFVSDGANDGGDPLEVIRDENQQLNNRVVIHTYGIGIGE